MFDEATDTQNNHLTEYPLEFRGTGSDYFRIWIVNLLLSIVTLGIYSAWATVRNRRFFYTHSFLDGHNFDFLGSPVAILRARIVAAILIFTYVTSQNLFPLVSLAILVIGLTLYPWIMNRAWSFKLRHTEYRNLRFNFSISDARAYMIQFPLLILAAATIGSFFLIFMKFGENEVSLNDASTPEVQLFYFAFFLSFATMFTFYITRIATKRFLTRQSLYGDHAFFSDMKILMMVLYLAISLVLFFVIILGSLAILILFASASIESLDQIGHVIEQGNSLIPFMVIFAYIVALQFSSAFYYVKTFNHWVNTAYIKEVNFQSNLKFWRYFFIQLTNFLLTICTLGLFYPYGIVRRYRYICNSLSVETKSLDHFAGDAQTKAGALGDELTDVFGIEVGF